MPFTTTQSPAAVTDTETMKVIPDTDIFSPTVVSRFMPFGDVVDTLDDNLS